MFTAMHFHGIPTAMHYHAAQAMHYFGAALMHFFGMHYHGTGLLAPVGYVANGLMLPVLLLAAAVLIGVTWSRHRRPLGRHRR